MSTTMEVAPLEEAGGDGAAATAEKPCPSCERPSASAFCPDCGEQMDLKHAYNLRAVMHHLAQEIFFLDRRFWRSYKTLLMKPGQLTRDHLQGRRVSFLRPLTMYFSVSAIYFFVISIAQPFVITDILFGIEIEDGQYEAVDYGLGTDIQQQSLENYRDLMAKLTERTGFSEREIRGRINRSYNSTLSLLMIMVVALFAVGMKVLYNHKYYYEHLIFTLHLFVFTFLMGMTALGLHHIDIWLGTAVTTLGMIMYVWFAARRVYEQGPWVTAFKSVTITVAYFITLSVMMGIALGGVFLYIALFTIK
ncbi:MAG: DUF3667 domain-containing protein [Bacteroidota bacterium]